ncbi:L,D-transpeptidase [Paenibacillus sacheonensis]|uniref:L,D-transpeptidase family protein n=1 Tax=Paenibacillus sacheonensis TaxID=742054 RepID=A0A7X4YKG8_9BACL|nr:L,D-transpeptidase [Paenibacillus sacheonensis]MBM7563697.1 lipoprotein-anchoring transpeptidase ErfK/SrfK [Paenibacillus sacheonensis]NBC67947.1 L,D-transpeptidase family protein [Paenibacillus sacheonensis]
MELKDDMNYLKRYVQNHPDNRMAWYLLGKQYMQEGKEAKANYCFLQSGSIYDAYERKQHPLVNEPRQILAVWNRKRKRLLLGARTSAAALVILALMLAFSTASSEEDAGEAADRQPMPGIEQAAGQEPGSGPRIAFVKPAGGDGTMLGNALGVLLRSASQTKEKGLAVSLEQDGKWRKWTGNTRLLAETERQGTGRAGVSLLDAKACDCLPDESTSARKSYTAWSKGQELRWTLSSAIAHYREQTSSWPSKLEDLVRPYPRNMLSGSSKAMKALFAPLLNVMKAEAAAGTGPQGGTGNEGGSGEQNAGESGGESVSASGEAPLSKEPLSIIVDKSNHQLAVVSGDVIVRSYAVGLGGGKTPSGQFVISEKVRDPNGRSDGEFGSRGMALSDTRYAIHGTNEPDSIGKDESHGCVRMARKDLEELYDLVPLGTEVNIKSGVLPDQAAPIATRFRLQPAQDETNSAKVYDWLD